MGSLPSPGLVKQTPAVRHGKANLASLQVQKRDLGCRLRGQASVSTGAVAEGIYCKPASVGRNFCQICT